MRLYCVSVRGGWGGGEVRWGGLTYTPHCQSTLLALTCFISLLRCKLIWNHCRDAVTVCSTQEVYCLGKTRFFFFSFVRMWWWFRPGLCSQTDPDMDSCGHSSSIQHYVCLPSMWCPLQLVVSTGSPHLHPLMTTFAFAPQQHVKSTISVTHLLHYGRSMQYISSFIIFGDTPGLPFRECRGRAPWRWHEEMRDPWFVNALTLQFTCVNKEWTKQWKSHLASLFYHVESNREHSKSGDLCNDVRPWYFHKSASYSNAP